ncbi:MAG TPA: helix-turn-helix transcriptional regulator [Candidatus Binatia bacterium]|nr:helix-turn-helix transcriptional regulator [Candidatus Binatia bacterium]
MTPTEIADLIARARVWRAPPWYARQPTDRHLVGGLIRRWRKGLGWSMRRLADELGVSVTSVRFWERGVSVPRERREAALRALGCQLPEIVRANRRGERDGYVWRGKVRPW